MAVSSNFGRRLSKVLAEVVESRFPWHSEGDLIKGDLICIHCSPACASVWLGRGGRDDIEE